MSNNIKLLMANRKVVFIVQLIFIAFSLFDLAKTDALFNVYVLCGIIGIIGLIYNSFINMPVILKRKKIIYFAVGLLFSICNIFANYQIVLNFSGVASFFNSCFQALFILIGSFSIGWNTLLMLDSFSNKSGRKNNGYKLSLLQTMLICFFVIVIINLVYLFFCGYPGNLTPDSISQMNQLLSNHYGNHHPFYHTMVIKGCVSLGMMLFGEINAAVACYSVFQIIFMAACFTYCVATQYQMNVPKPWIILTICFFALMPYHIAYSITMWKDIPFGGAVLLLITALFRLFKNIGKYKWLNWFLLIVGALGTCLWRSNGWIAFAITLIVFLICFFKQYKKVTIVFSMVLIVTYIMIHPVLAYLGVNQPDTIESLSIPAQQIARVVVSNGNISAEEYELLNKIIDTNKIADEYKPYISDPIKGLVRKTDNQKFLNDHKIDYLKLWISIGLKNPFKYIEAWVDQTKGYWNGGYRYWIWSENVHDNRLGIQKVSGSLIGRLHGLQGFVFDQFYENSFYDVFRSIGLCTWIIIACSCISLANKRGKRAFLCVPLLAIIATLCIATPVYSEFRYAYALFTCIPLIICTTFYKEKGEIING